MLAGIDGLLLQELAKPSRSRSRSQIESFIGATQHYAKVLRAARRETTSRNAGRIDRRDFRVA